ncbi:hypothetical protein KHQ89_07250 [Mycoplasmatota bacterium]|nr:hypothetical protein KHQ89_07250 [Mycoplasmatota bacterium]
MSLDNMIKTTKSELNQKIILESPWNEYSLEDINGDYFLKQDLEEFNRSENKSIVEMMKRKVYWKNEDADSFKKQIPVPINGNFLKAEYLLLYSNPGTEKKQITNPHDLNELLKCFNLDENAKLVLPNKQWTDWYLGELDKFYIERHNENITFDWEKFSDKFCFINYFAYPTKNNQFDFTVKETEIINKLPSTKFVKELIEIGRKNGKKIIVIRRSEGVWKHHKKNMGHPYKKLSNSYKEYIDNRDK